MREEAIVLCAFFAIMVAPVIGVILLEAHRISALREVARLAAEAERSSEQRP